MAEDLAHPITTLINTLNIGFLVLTSRRKDQGVSL